MTTRMRGQIESAFTYFMMGVLALLGMALASLVAAMSVNVWKEVLR